MALEESVLTREDIETLLTLEYGIHLVNHSQLSFGTANCYKIICAEGEFFLKEYQSRFTLEDIEREAKLVEFLISKEYPTAGFIKTLKGNYGTMHEGHAIGVQEYVSGETYENELPHSLLLESAAYLGRLHQLLKDYPLKTDMDDKWVQGFSVQKACAQCDELLDTIEKDKSDPYYERIREDLAYKNELNLSLEKMKRYYDGITYLSTHGDYSACQLIGENGRIKAVIDFSSAVSLPIVWEIMRAYIQSSSACKDGRRFDLDDFLLFVKEYLKYAPLTRSDLKAMPYVYLFQLGRSYYGFKEYLLTKASNKDKLIEFAFWRTDICRQIGERAEEISAALLQLV